MAVKKAAAKKTTAKKAAPKKAALKKPVRTAAAKKGLNKGDKYVCNVCGLVLAVDKACGCVESCDIICCDKPMKKKKK